MRAGPEPRMRGSAGGACTARTTRTARIALLDRVLDVAKIFDLDPHHVA
jgi:hypothetical protein